MTEAIFLDIDGTLVSMKTHAVPQSTIDALSQAKSRGVKIFISTGRPTSLINNIGALQSLDLIDGYVTMNGAYCIVNGNAISRNTLSVQEVQAIVQYSLDNGLSCAVIRENDSLVFQPTELFRSIFYDKIDVAPMKEITFNDIFTSHADGHVTLKEDIFQLSPFVHIDRENELRSQIPQCEFNRWHPTFADICAQNSTKAQGLDTIAEHFGFSINNVIAIGDGGNDIPMLQHAGIGVAMGNASDTVKAAANYISTHIDDNGIYNALKHLNVI